MIACVSPGFPVSSFFAREGGLWFTRFQAGLKLAGHETKSQTVFRRSLPLANPVQFINQVRTEGAKITWPTRREVVTTTIMVFIMASLASLFFFLVDLVIRFGITEGLKLVSG